MQVLDDGVIEFLFLLGRVCVAEPNNEFAIECFVGEIIVEESGFGMADVQISAVFD